MVPVENILATGILTVVVNASTFGAILKNHIITHLNFSCLLKETKSYLFTAISQQKCQMFEIAFNSLHGHTKQSEHQHNVLYRHDEDMSSLSRKKR